MKKARDLQFSAVTAISLRTHPSHFTGVEITGTSQ